MARSRHVAWIATAVACLALAVLAAAAPAAAASAGSVSINGGAAVVNARDVTLSVSPTDPSLVVELRIANAAHMDGAATVPYAPTVPWSLPGPDGVKSVYVQFGNGAGDWSDAVFDDILLDTTAPSGSVGIGGKGTAINRQDVTLSLSGVSPDVTEVRLWNDGDEAASVTVPFSATQIPWMLAAGPDGHRTIHAEFRDAAGNRTRVSSAFDLDRSAPIALPPRPAFGVEMTQGPRHASVLLHLGARDGTASSGIEHYRVEVQVDGGAWRWAGTPSTSPERMELLPGHTYRWRSRATDEAGNIGPFTIGGRFRPTAYQETSRSIAYRGRWRSVASSTASAGRLRHASAAGASAKLWFTGRSIAWVARVGPTRGSARVYVDGRFVQRVSLYRASPGVTQIVYVRSWARVGSHRIRIVVTGTPGHSRVDLDAFLVLR